MAQVKLCGLESVQHYSEELAGKVNEETVCLLGGSSTTRVYFGLYVRISSLSGYQLLVKIYLE